MKNLRSLMFCLAAFLLFVIDISAQRSVQTSIANDDWVGKYEYTYTEGKTAGGWVPVIEYVLIVSREGDSLVARFTADGYQTYHDYAYTAKANGSQLDFYFLRDLNDGDVSGIKRRFKKGQLVGSLVKITSRGKTRYMCKNGGYQISFNPEIRFTLRKPNKSYEY